MAFDWIRFLETYRVPFAAEGKNVSRGHVVVHCPFCGSADTGMHMSVNTEGRGWRCFRNKDQHKGKSPVKLVMGLISCSYERAQEIVGTARFVPTDFMARVQASLSPPAIIERKPPPMPPEFKPIRNVPSARMYLRYLKDRGFDDREIMRLTKRYDVYYATRGPYGGRIIFCVYMNGRLVSWTGRALSKNNDLRYKTLSDDPERSEREGLAPALGPISNYLLWYDELIDCDADTLVLCEGPFDALKVNVLGWDHGIAATCFFTASPTEQQVELLHDLCPQFKRRVLLLDSGTLATGLRVAAGLSTLGVTSKQLPSTLKDPGEFTPYTFRKILLEDIRVVP